MGPACRKYIDRLMARECVQCHVISVCMKLNTDLFMAGLVSCRDKAIILDSRYILEAVRRARNVKAQVLYTKKLN